LGVLFGLCGQPIICKSCLHDVVACTQKALPVTIQEAAVKTVTNLSRHPANRTALYKSKLSETHRQFVNDVLLASGAIGEASGSTFSDTLLPDTTSKSAAFKLTMDQLFGVLTGKFRASKGAATVSNTVRLEETLDTALDTARWMESDARRAGIACLSKDRSSSSLPVLSSPKQVVSQEISSPPSRQARLYSLPTPASPGAVEEATLSMISPVVATNPTEARDQLKLPSPIRISHRHSGVLASL
jgi:hypothetical protein